MSGILEEALDITTKARKNSYGNPSDDFARASSMYQPILESNIDPRLKHALLMIQVKISRLLNTPDHHDSLVDIAGYANTYDMVLDEIKEEKNV